MAEDTKRFTVGKGEKGLVMISDASGNPRQATSYTRDGDTLRFALAGDGGAVYSVKKGDAEFDELAEAFGVGDEDGEKPAPKSSAKADPKPAAAASA